MNKQQMIEEMEAIISKYCEFEYEACDRWDVEKAAKEIYSNHLKAQQREIERLREALDQSWVGGNHLANILVHKLGSDFSEKYPHDLDTESALRLLCDTFEHDVWAAWSCIMTGKSLTGEGE